MTMSSKAVCLALALLAAPPDTPEPPVPAEDWPALQTALQELAVELEILDPREVRYVLTRPEDFETDLNLLRRRYHELADAPRLSDGGRFPDRNSVNEYLAFNRAYRRYLDARQPLEPDRTWQFREALRETDWLYQVWDAVRDARCEFYYVTVRRQALKRLRDLVGPDAYYNGELPPYVPVWRFQDIK
jgi:hypothetical protein